MNNTTDKICESPLCASEENGTYDTPSKHEKRLFTQRELEKCIGERLMRERRNNASLQNIKKLVDGLCEKGILNADSYAEAERELCEKLCSENAGNMREENSEGDMLPEVTDKEKIFECEISGEFASEIQPLQNRQVTAEPESLIPHEDCDIKEEKDTDNQEICEESDASGALPEEKSKNRTEELCELCLKYPSLNAAQLLESKEFAVYSKGKDGTLLELYEGFTSLLGALESFNRSRASEYGSQKNAPCDVPNHQRHAMKALSSTGFSRLSASESSDFSELLSPSQRNIARRAGISYREYAQLLSDIPDSSRIKKYNK